MVRAGRGDDLVPDYGLVGVVLGAEGRPLCRHVDEYLLGVPGEEGREVGIEGELDDCVFFLFGRVVVRSPLDDLEGGGLEEVHGGGSGGEKVGEGDEGGDCEGDCCEEAEGVLEADDGGIHREGGLVYVLGLRPEIEG